QCSPDSNSVSFSFDVILILAFLAFLAVFFYWVPRLQPDYGWLLFRTCLFKSSADLRRFLTIIFCE
ncbi:MAG: hypothetical protein LBE12_04930, partial [Planctomycetaceae bacterium]|nr:hypothetical protein [Planctomycetaceae bacterium]